MVQIAIDDDTQTWRDLVDRLPAEWVAQLERAEELEAAGVTPWRANSQADNAALSLLFKIKVDIETHQAGIRFAHVPIPAQASHADQWMNMGSKEEPDWGRRLEGARFEVGEGLGHVLIEGTQQAADGSVEWGVRWVNGVEDWMEARAARRLTDALRAAAEVVESL
ncbi:hypothetical protein [Mycobacteroides abscessus]|uniref:hypothetical protein n=1 Tax=Mycobacteroides abscessus TaxID=36809 RepID=UPI000C25CE99|nr:hypothetical protein [Mycobacteroides abscessus]RIR93855.1 hypothetical protein D2E58_23075 [Mycobacteroides abscessus]RIS53240.1 hypothetical protein D2E46_21295 [Mycobacteroides abscessus]